MSAIAATNDTVYVGGSFLAANGVARTRLAAFRASDGALLHLGPDGQDQQVSPGPLAGRRHALRGGKFAGLNGDGIRASAPWTPSPGQPAVPVNATIISNGGDAAASRA